MMSGGRNTTNPVSAVSNVSTSATPAMAVSNAATSITGEGCSEGLVEGVSGMADPMGFPPTHNSTPSGSSENSFNILTYLSPQTLPNLANITTTGSSSNGLSRIPYLAAGFDRYGRPTYEPNGVPPPPVTPQFNPFDFWPPQPSSISLNLVQAWQVNVFYMCSM